MAALSARRVAASSSLRLSPKCLRAAGLPTDATNCSRDVPTKTSWRRFSEALVVSLIQESGRRTGSRPAQSRCEASCCVLRVTHGQEPSGVEISVTQSDTNEVDQIGARGSVLAGGRQLERRLKHQLTNLLLGRWPLRSCTSSSFRLMAVERRPTPSNKTRSVLSGAATSSRVRSDRELLRHHYGI